MRGEGRLEGRGKETSFNFSSRTVNVFCLGREQKREGKRAAAAEHCRMTLLRVFKFLISCWWELSGAGVNWILWGYGCRYQVVIKTNGTFYALALKIIIFWLLNFLLFLGYIALRDRHLWNWVFYWHHLMILCGNQLMSRCLKYTLKKFFI